MQLKYKRTGHTLFINGEAPTVRVDVMEAVQAYIKHHRLHTGYAASAWSVRKNLTPILGTEAVDEALARLQLK